MADPSPSIPVDAQYLTTAQASIFTGLSQPFLEQARSRGYGGPRYSKIGAAVRYARSDLVTFMEELCCDPEPKKATRKLRRKGRAVR